MLVLGIETSCDETAAAVVEDGRLVKSSVIASSKNDFQKLGGVIPEDAARKQLESILPVIHKALADAKIEPKELGLISVTSGPGLLGSLLVGTTTARALAKIWNVPLIGVHHTLGHLSSTWLISSAPTQTPAFPILTLSISGGHSDLWMRTSHTKGKLVGSTRDDAAGEAFDKGAVMLGLPYPGGPHLMKLAENGDCSEFKFPLPLQKEKTCDFSFSGLKTSLKYLLRDLGTPIAELPEKARASIAASFQRAICEHLKHQVEHALKNESGIKELHVVGGVAANTEVKRILSELASEHSIAIRLPMDIRSCTDNGAMIASAGYFLAQERPELIGKDFETKATIDLKTVLS